MRDWIDATREMRSALVIYEAELYPLFVAGYLYSSGGVEEQDALYLDFMREIGHLKKLTEARAMEIIEQRAREERELNGHG